MQNTEFFLGINLLKLSYRFTRHMVKLSAKNTKRFFTTFA